MKLSFQDRGLTVSDSTWTLNRPVLDAIQQDDRVFVIFDYMSYPRGRPAKNLVCFDLAGRELWVVADNPIDHPTAAYTNFVAADPLTVGNFVGFTCVVDPLTGELLDSQFTK